MPCDLQDLRPALQATAELARSSSDCKQQLGLAEALLLSLEKDLSVRDLRTKQKSDRFCR